MAFLLNAGDRFETRFYCYHDGSSQMGVNTVRFSIGSITPGVPVNSDDLAFSLGQKYAPEFKALLDSSARYAGLSIQDFPNRIWIPDYSTQGAGAGTVAGNDCPTQASGLISLRTLYAGPQGRGRIYVPFPSVTSNETDGLPTDAYVALLQALADELVGPIPLIVGLDLVQVIIFPIISNAAGTGFEKRVEDAQGVQKWATQRRRGSYGRKNVLPGPLA